MEGEKMVDELIEILEEIGYPVYRQGSLSDTQEYPDHFFTFWNTGSPDHASYDNKKYGTSWDFSIYFYSVDPDKTYDVLATAQMSLKRNGWIVTSMGYDVESDVETHTGRGVDVQFLEI